MARRARVCVRVCVCVCMVLRSDLCELTRDVSYEQCSRNCSLHVLPKEVVVHAHSDQHNLGPSQRPCVGQGLPLERAAARPVGGGIERKLPLSSIPLPAMATGGSV